MSSIVSNIDGSWTLNVTPGYTIDENNDYASATITCNYSQVRTLSPSSNDNGYQVSTGVPGYDGGTVTGYWMTGVFTVVTIHYWQGRLDVTFNDYLVHFTIDETGKVVGGSDVGRCAAPGSVVVGWMDCELNHV